MTVPIPPSTPTASPAPRATLSRELGEFLIEFSISLNKFAMYPGGHPSLQPAVENLIRKLELLLADRGTLSVGVARQQLVIEGVATDAKNPVLNELAGRLHRHHLGAITFSRGVELSELVDFIGKVSIEADHSEQPLGLAGDQLTDWSHVRLYPLMYDRLEMLDDAGQEETRGEDSAARSHRTRAAQLWVGMARAALAAGDTPPPPTPGAETAEPGQADADLATDPASVARAIESHPRGTAYDQVIVGYMLQIADELKRAGGAESAQLNRRMKGLVSALDKKALSRLLDMGGDRTQRRQFLLNASQGMAVEAVMELVNAASNAEEQTVSHSMLRMLQKLARHADGGTGDRRVVAETQVRDQIAELIRGWSLKDPNPEAYQKALEALSSSNPVFAVAPDAVFAPESKRIVQMALEVNAAGEPVTRAVSELTDHQELGWLIDMLKTAGSSSVSSEIWRQIATPEQLGAILRNEPIDVGVMDGILPHLGLAVAGVLLDALTEVHTAQSRRLLLDRIVKLGFEVGPAAMARLSDERWYVKRNMLKILGDLEILPPDLRASDYLQHEDPRVRREALRIVLRDPSLRERAIARALGDPDDRMVRAALASAMAACPPSALPLVAARALSGSTEDQRVAAIRVLGASGIRTAIDTLLKIASPRKSLFGARLPSKSPELLAAIAALRQYADDPRAKDVLDQAAQSRDAEVAQAAGGGS